MPTITQNRFWGDAYGWDKEGDEWDDQAGYCGQPYAAWKRSIVKYFIAPYLRPHHTALEIAPGYGRWSIYLVKKAKNVILVDLNKKCIDHCRKKFSGNKRVDFHVNDGMNLRFIDAGSVDFIWSYDSFVHMERDVVDAYVNEFSRILKHGGTAIIHHAGRRMLPLKVLRKLGRWGGYAYQVLSMRKILGTDGWRSDVSRKTVRDAVARSQLLVECQVDTWGPNHEFNVKLFRDVITVLRKE